MSLVKAENISKRYRDHVALDDLSLEVEKGSIYGLLGPNGAGKTTLIRIINQIIAPDSGRVLFDGEKLHPKHIAQIGYMPEERGLYRNMKVGEQALYLAQLKGMSYSDAKNRIKYWFEKFEIGGWWNKRIDELSKGMAQKVQFIVTVLHDPQLLIFDEPFSGFDPVNAQMIKDEILELKQKGSTVLFSTHRMESVEEMCDNIALINKSHKILDGEIGEIKRRHRDDRYNITINRNDFYKLDQIDGVESIFNYSVNRNFSDQLDVTIRKSEGIRSQEMLKKLLDIVELHNFSERIPGINEIFIKHVGKEKQDNLIQSR